MSAVTLQAMRAFRAVVELKSFRRAGDRLDLGSSAVSKLIAALERELGAALLARTTRSLSLTEAGAAFYESAVRVTDEADHAIDRVREHDGQPAGLLRVSVPASFGICWLAPRLPRFLERHPRLRVDLSLNDRLVDLVAEGFDCALRIATGLRDSTLHARTLGAVPRVLVAAPRYLRRAPPLRAPADLAAHNALEFSLSATGHVWPFLVDGRTQEVTVSGNLSVDNSVMLRAALVAGTGIALTPRFVVEDLLQSRRLVTRLDAYLPAPHRLFGVTVQRRHPPGKTRAFLDFVAAEMAAGPATRSGDAD